MTVYIYKMLIGAGLNPTNAFEKVSEKITEHEEHGWQFVQFLDRAGFCAVVRKPKN